MKRVPTEKLSKSLILEEAFAEKWLVTNCSNVEPFTGGGCSLLCPSTLLQVLPCSFLDLLQVVKVFQSGRKKFPKSSSEGNFITSELFRARLQSCSSLFCSTLSIYLSLHLATVYLHLIQLVYAAVDLSEWTSGKRSLKTFIGTNRPVLSFPPGNRK